MIRNPSIRYVGGLSCVDSRPFSSYMSPYCRRIALARQCLPLAMTPCTQHHGQHRYPICFLISLILVIKGFPVCSHFIKDALLRSNIRCPHGLWRQFQNNVHMSYRRNGYGDIFSTVVLIRTERNGKAVSHYWVPGNVERGRGVEIRVTEGPS